MLFETDAQFYFFSFFLPFAATILGYCISTRIFLNILESRKKGEKDELFPFFWYWFNWFR